MATPVLTKGTNEAKDFGQRLAEIRKEKLDMSQAELARNIKREDGSTWHTSYVTNIERGEQPPAREFVEQLAVMAEMSAEEILPDGVSLDELRAAYRRRSDGRTRRPRRQQGESQKVVDIQSGRSNGNTGKTTPVDQNGISVEMRSGVVVVTIDVADIVASALSR